jgi:heat-inducible transcriptional repressor
VSDERRLAGDDRKLEVLRAIIEDFVTTSEPVGSKALVERHALGVSSATIRNDMALLEDEGYIVQPHTSAGRIPTDKGYRLFVDRLSQLRPLSQADARQSIPSSTVRLTSMTLARHGAACAY